MRDQSIIRHKQLVCRSFYSLKRKRKEDVGIEFGLNNDETGSILNTEFNLLRALKVTEGTAHRVGQITSQVGL